MQAAMQALQMMSSEEQKAMVLSAISQQMGVNSEQIASYIEQMGTEALTEYAMQIMMIAVSEEYANTIQAQLGALTTDELAAMFATFELTEKHYEDLYENYLPSSYSESTYEDNVKLLGYADSANPSAINIFAESFENKDEISRLIKEYNSTAAEEDIIEYTDFVALLMSSITTIINAISYVLIAFVAISLVVSSIMIGIITYISVLERTKEIGILRAIGASKKDISRVFNAETLIVGFTSGGIGILVSLFFVMIINISLHKVTGVASLSAVLPVSGAVILIVISMLLTFIAGLFPSKVAARKDPVIALRSE